MTPNGPRLDINENCCVVATAVVWAKDNRVPFNPRRSPCASWGLISQLPCKDRWLINDRRVSLQVSERWQLSSCRNKVVSRYIVGICFQHEHWKMICSTQCCRTGHLSYYLGTAVSVTATQIMFLVSSLPFIHPVKQEQNQYRASKRFLRYVLLLPACSLGGATVLCKRLIPGDKSQQAFLCCWCPRLVGSLSACFKVWNAPAEDKEWIWSTASSCNGSMSYPGLYYPKKMHSCWAVNRSSCQVDSSR